MATTTVEVTLSTSAYTGVSNALANVAIFMKPSARIRCNIGLNASPPAAGITAYAYLRKPGKGELGSYVKTTQIEGLLATDNIFLMSEGVAETVLVVRGESKSTF